MTTTPHAVGASIPVILMGVPVLTFNYLYGFLETVFLAEIFGITSFSFLVYWMATYILTEDRNNTFFTQLCWHPILMYFSMVLILGNSIITYRALRFLPHKYLKAIHGVVNFFIIIIAIVGLVVIIFHIEKSSHPPSAMNDTTPDPTTSIPTTNKSEEYFQEVEVPSRLHFRCLHSWMGCLTIILAILQAFAGFFGFIWPSARPSMLALLHPYHQFFGNVIFILSISSSICGMSLVGDKYIDLYFGGNTGKGISTTLNISGITAVLYGIFIIFLTTNAAYERFPNPAIDFKNK